MNKKDQYVAKLHTTIDQWSAKLDRADARVKALEAGARERYRDTLGNLKQKLADVKARARELEQAREDTWEAIKRSVEVGVEEFKREYQGARDKRNLTELEALPPATDAPTPGHPDAQ